MVNTDYVFGSRGQDETTAIVITIKSKLHALFEKILMYDDFM